MARPTSPGNGGPGTAVGAYLVGGSGGSGEGWRVVGGREGGWGEVGGVGRNQCPVV